MMRPHLQRLMRWTATHPRAFVTLAVLLLIVGECAARALARAARSLSAPQPAETVPPGPGPALSPPAPPRDPSNPSRAVPPPLDPSPMARTLAALRAGDITEDGRIDSRDLAQLIARWGEATDAPPPMLTFETREAWWIGDHKTGFGVWRTYPVAVQTCYITSARVVYPGDLDAALFYEYTAGVVIPSGPLVALWCNAWALDPWAAPPFAPVLCPEVSNHPSRPTRFFLTSDVAVWAALTGAPLPPPADGAGSGGGDDGSP